MWPARSTSISKTRQCCLLDFDLCYMSFLLPYSCSSRLLHLSIRDQPTSHIWSVLHYSTNASSTIGRNWWHLNVCSYLTKIEVRSAFSTLCPCRFWLPFWYYSGRAINFSLLMPHLSRAAVPSSDNDWSICISILVMTSENLSLFRTVRLARSITWCLYDHELLRIDWVISVLVIQKKDRINSRCKLTHPRRILFRYYNRKRR